MTSHLINKNLSEGLYEDVEYSELPKATVLPFGNFAPEKTASALICIGRLSLIIISVAANIVLIQSLLNQEQVSQISHYIQKR